MTRVILSALALCSVPVAAYAQMAPLPGIEDPRLQTVVYDPTRPVRLVAFPGANLTVMLAPGEQVTRAVVSDEAAFQVRITGSNDSLNILPLRPDAQSSLIVDTAQRHYEFDLDTGEGLAAAYIVRFVAPDSVAGMPMPPAPALSPPLELVGNYRLDGERVLRPATIGDDGERTYIEWDEYQSLPAVFGIGPTGAEEVVDGYMRDGRFVIDRVYGELVFRIDKKRAIARRLTGLGNG